MKIIVIGSGIAGLTFASACEQAGFNVKIFEKTSKLLNIGGGLLLWPHGVRYLKYLGLHAIIKPFFHNVLECNVIDHLGNIIFKENISEFLNVLGGPILPIERDTLQQALIKNLPPRVLTFGKSCLSVAENKNKAVVKFSDGSFEEADLVVGADGIHSVVRSCLLGPQKPTYTNLCWWGGIVNNKYVPQFQSHQQLVILGEKKTFIAWPTYNGKWLWYVIAKIPSENIIKNNSGLDQLKSICKNWNKDIFQIISSPTEKIFQLGVYTHSPVTVWSSHRVTLIGDAAHAMGPILAQGTSLAIEDAFTLFKLLQHPNKNITEVLQTYEQIRSHTFKRMFELENQCANMMVADNLQNLEKLQQVFAHASLPVMYQDLIPLVDKAASLRLMKLLACEEYFLSSHY